MDSISQRFGAIRDISQQLGGVREAFQKAYTSQTEKAGALPASVAGAKDSGKEKSSFLKLTAALAGDVIGRMIGSKGPSHAQFVEAVRAPAQEGGTTGQLIAGFRAAASEAEKADTYKKFRDAIKGAIKNMPDEGMDGASDLKILLEDKEFSLEDGKKYLGLLMTALDAKYPPASGG